MSEKPKMEVQSSDHQITFIVKYENSYYKREYHSDTGVTIWWKAHYHPRSRLYSQYQHGWTLVSLEEHKVLEQAFKVWEEKNKKPDE